MKKKSGCVLRLLALLLALSMCPSGAMASSRCAVEEVYVMEESSNEEETAPAEPHWDGDRYYLKDGSYVIGSRKIDGIYYVFGADGYLLRPNKKSLIKVEGEIYYVDSKGHPVHGWQVIDDNLYYVKANGKVLVNRSYIDIEFDSKGRAKMTRRAKERIQALKGGKAFWKTYSDYTCYVKANGERAVGSKSISGKYYIFNKDGELEKTGSNHKVKVDGKTYLAAADGTALKGWWVFSGKLYCAKSSGLCYMDCTYDDFKFGSDGAVLGMTKVREKAKKTSVKIFREITTSKMSKSEMLKACWNYCVSTSRFRYVSKYPNLDKKNWQMATAYDMLTTRTGN